MSNWIKCSERLPEEGAGRYLVLLNGAYPLVGTYMLHRWSADVSTLDASIDVGIDSEVTHWQHLPEPPEVEE
jgi:hypothetical protein